MPAPKRSATKPSPAARPVIRPAAGSATPRVDPQLELFGRAVAATQQKHWKQAAGLLRRLLADTDDISKPRQPVTNLTWAPAWFRALFPALQRRVPFGQHLRPARRIQIGEQSGRDRHQTTCPCNSP